MNRIIGFMASIKLAIPLMVLLTIAMIAGTIVESKYSTEIAQKYIYYHLWFVTLNFFIALNIFLATWVRYPYKKSQTGFVITHLGLLFIFGGSISTQLFGIDGYLVLRENSKSNVVDLRAEEDKFILPFVVELKEFRLKSENSTMALMDYESEVSIAGKSYTINMNNPLQMNGFYIYQNSYQMEKSGNISIFSVGYDPGRTFKYLGSFFLVFGMMIMFWFKTGIFQIKGIKKINGDEKGE
jgi:cytochrome c biogenesis protein ResB